MRITDTNTSTIVHGWLTEMGFERPSPELTARQLVEAKPNITNLVAIQGVSRNELHFAEDGMPLLGIFSNSYDHAPKEFQRDLQPYPRQDSPSREQGTREGARINAGADRHLIGAFAPMMNVLRGISAARRGYTADPVQPGVELNAQQSLDVVNASVALWSQLLHRKGTPAGYQIPAEVGILHRSMSGVRLSLLSLYFGSDVHAFRTVPSDEPRTFSAAAWAEETEASGLLVARKESYPRLECPAPTKMIGRVIQTVTGPLGEAPATDLRETYGVEPDSVIDFGRAYFDIEQNRQMLMDLIKIHGEAANLTIGLMGGVIVRSELEELRASFKANMEPGKAHQTIMDDALKRATRILGYATKPPVKKPTKKKKR